MPSFDIPHLRLHNQYISRATFDKPADVVAWLGAVQAQDYLGALWALGLRMRDASEQMIEQAIAEKTIVRTWPMRGTLHFVAPADVRWMLDLLTPRVVQGSQGRLRQLGLDSTMQARGRPKKTPDPFNRFDPFNRSGGWFNGASGALIGTGVGFGAAEILGPILP